MRGQPSRGVARWTLLLSTVALLWGCAADDPATQRVTRARKGSGELVLAAVWPWQLRKEIRYGEGLQMAVDEANAAGGVNGRPLRIARYDDEETIDRSRVVAQEIAADPEVVAVIGHLQSYTTVEAATVYDQAGLVLVAPTATDPELTSRGYRRVFRATFTDSSVGRQLAEFVAARQLKRVAVCYIRNNYGRNVANEFESRALQLGLSIVARSSYDSSAQASERTFQQTLLEWKPIELDAIVIAGEVPAAAILVSEARKAGIQALIIGGDAMSSPGLMAVAGQAAEGVMVASFFHAQEPRPEIPEFTAAFTKKYGVPPDAGSALGYDCVRLLVHAMRRAGSAVPDDVAREVHALTGWKGVTGTFSFDERGDIPGKSVVMSTVRDGAFTYLTTLTAPAIQRQ
ncbi:MAG: ABC transporter substrate-binding protein [Vicinamibacteria bacterium]